MTGGSGTRGSGTVFGLTEQALEEAEEQVPDEDHGDEEEDAGGDNHGEEDCADDDDPDPAHGREDGLPDLRAKALLVGHFIRAPSPVGLHSLRRLGGLKLLLAKALAGGHLPPAKRRPGQAGAVGEVLDVGVGQLTDRRDARLRQAGIVVRPDSVDRDEGGVLPELRCGGHGENHPGGPATVASDVREIASSVTLLPRAASSGFD